MTNKISVCADGVKVKYEIIGGKEVVITSYSIHYTKLYDTKRLDMSKKNVRTAETKSVVSQGLCLLEDIVCGTMGPGGRNVILENSSGAPVITKDGA